MPVWTDKTIGITLDEQEMELARWVLENGVVSDDPRWDDRLQLWVDEVETIVAKIAPSTTLTHYEAEVLRGAIQRHANALGRDDEIARRIAAALTAVRIVPR